MKALILSCIALVALATLPACQEIGAGGRVAVKDAKVAVEDTKEAIKELLYYKPSDEEYKPIPYTFCYEVMQDVTCYNQPLPEARGRLVGWQGRGEFNIRDPKDLPAKTALVRQPRKAPKRTAVEEVFEEKKVEEEPELVSLEPVYIPEEPEETKAEDKTVTIKVTEEENNTLY